jgi:hypothetical protein
MSLEEKINGSEVGDVYPIVCIPVYEQMGHGRRTRSFAYLRG